MTHTPLFEEGVPYPTPVQSVLGELPSLTSQLLYGANLWCWLRCVFDASTSYPSLFDPVPGHWNMFHVLETNIFNSYDWEIINISMQSILKHG